MTAEPRVPIALFLTSLGTGGTERQMLELAARLDRRRFVVHLACFHRAGPWVTKAERAADSIAEFPLSSFHSGSAAREGRRFARWCREHRIALVQACDLYANIFALPVALAAGVGARFASRREIRPDKSIGQVALQRLAYGCAHRVVANSEASARQVRAEGVRASRVVTIPNGIDLAAFVAPRRSGPIRRIVSVAAFRPEKAHDVLIEGFAAASAELPALSLTLAGDGPTRPACEEQVRRRGLERSVRFLGRQDDVPAVLRDADAFVLASRSEACPNSVVEAMAMALPVIATDVGGVPELVEPHRTGVLVPPDQAGELGRAIVGVARQPESAWSMGRSAREAVAGRFSFELMVDRFESLYERSLPGLAPGTHRGEYSRPPVASCPSTRLP